MDVCGADGTLGEARLRFLQYFTKFYNIVTPFAEQAASGVPLGSLSKWAVLLARSIFYKFYKFYKNQPFWSSKQLWRGALFVRCGPAITAAADPHRARRPAIQPAPLL